MQFHIDIDTDALIAGWVLPDNPSTVPTLIISPSGRPEIAVSANVPRPDIRDLGHHNTGMVGFSIDDTVVPDLAQLADLQIHESESGVLIHRRAKGLARKILWLDLASMPSAAVADTLLQRFTLYYGEIERHPFNTMFSILNNQQAASLLAMGRPLLARYDEVLRRNNFMVMAILRHPREDLAQRLLLAREIAIRGSEHDVASLAPLVELARTTSLEQADALESALAKVAGAHPRFVVNPFVRTLACSPDDRPEQRHISIALNNLAAMDLVGLSSRFDEFKTMLAEILNEDVLNEFTLKRPLELDDMTRRLSTMPAVERFLALDLSLYSYVEEAIETAAASSS